MNNIKKKQPPKGIGIVAFDGFSQLILSSFMVPAIKTSLPLAQTVLITSPQFAPYGKYFNYDRVISVEPTHLNRFKVKIYLKIYFRLMNINGF
jgi:hypothetical protein